ncbi:hypothetical protein OUG_1215 [Helicobacter pylori R32b]|nr:hypothetical protein OUG_1215 [Helicobacter pylori R32b]
MCSLFWWENLACFIPLLKIPIHYSASDRAVKKARKLKTLFCEKD